MVLKKRKKGPSPPYLRVWQVIGTFVVK